MDSYIYILVDGKNTKIGVTSALEKRMSTYATHNVNIQEYKKYLCAIDEAKRVEVAIKQIFKSQLTGRSTEWFAVSPEVVDRYVSTLLEKPIATNVLPSMHGVRLTDEAAKLKEEITKAVTNKNSKSEAIRTKKQELAELFSNRFSLGIPEHKLPEDIVVKDGLCVDIRHCAHPDKSEIVRKAIRHYIQMPHDDHVWRYFHLVRLDSGFYVAICTAQVSMPYLEAISKEGAKQEMVDTANELGWYCTFHNDWSWHHPNKTGLALYQPKTAIHTTIKLWENSFRKWIIERKKMLEYEPFPNKKELDYLLKDITQDTSFPLDINSYQDFYSEYFCRFFGEYPHWQENAFTYLITKWKSAAATT